MKLLVCWPTSVLLSGVGCGALLFWAKQIHFSAVSTERSVTCLQVWDTVFLAGFPNAMACLGKTPKYHSEA